MRDLRVVRPPRRPCPGSASGSVTVEAALVVPSLLVVTLLAATVLSALRVALVCADAARVAASALGRGDSTAEAVRLARADAPPGAWVQVLRAGPVLVVRVGVTVLPPGPLAWAPGLPVTAHAAALAPRRGQ